LQVGSAIKGAAAGDRFGCSLALSSSGQKLAVGAEMSDGAGVDAGRVRVYELKGSLWLQLGVDLDGEAAGDRFGSSLALSSSGKTLAVGAKFNDGAGANAGRVRVFNFQGDKWENLGPAIDGEAAGNNFGGRVALSGDGGKLVVGGPRNNGAGQDAGRVRVYEFKHTSWLQVGSDLDGAAAGDRFGSSVVLSTSGTTLAIGGRQAAGAGPGAVLAQPYTDVDGTSLVHSRICVCRRGCTRECCG
jgi:hypothetical protein